MGRLVIGLKDRKDLGLTTVLLVAVSARSGVEASSFALWCTGADDSPDRTAKGFLDAGGFVDAFTLSQEPSVSFIELCRSESMSRISSTPFMARSFVRSMEARSLRPGGLDGTFTMGGICA
jgi:hypothetical protein